MQRDLFLQLFRSDSRVLVRPGCPRRLYTNSTTGAVRVTAFQDLDIGIRHPESFSVMLDALTV